MSGRKAAGTEAPVHAAAHMSPAYTVHVHEHEHDETDRLKKHPRREDLRKRRPGGRSFSC